MALFNSFTILLGILLGSSLLSWFKEVVILEVSVLSVGIIMILYLGLGDNENIFSWKIWLRNWIFNIDSNFSKIVIDGISNVW